jgi:hypothetical protein
MMPTDGGARVADGLAHGLERAPDVRADEKVRALEFGGAALVVIRQRDAQGGDAEAREDAAQLRVALRVRVPVRQQDDGAARTIFVRACFDYRREEARAHGVVLRRGRADAARPREQIAAQTVVFDRRQREELFAAGDGAGGVRGDERVRVVAVRVRDDVLRAPLEGAHASVIVAAREPALVRVHQTCEQSLCL